jgi:pyruvate kinase
MQRVLKPNDVIYFDDGKVVGIIIDIQPSSARMEIKIGGVMKGNCQVRFTNGKHAHLPPVTNSDIHDLSQLSQQIMIDYVALPFASSDEDIH